MTAHKRPGPKGRSAAPADDTHEFMRAAAAKIGAALDAEEAQNVKSGTWTKVRGTARVFEKDGQLFLRFPKSIIVLFGLKAGDNARFRKCPRKRPLSPEKLTAITRKMVEAKTPHAAQKLTDQLVDGFYGKPLSFLVTFFRAGKQLMPKKK